MLNCSPGYDVGWFVIKSYKKPFTGFDHATNVVHNMVNFLTCCLFLKLTQLSKVIFFANIMYMYYLHGSQRSLDPRMYTIL